MRRVGFVGLFVGPALAVLGLSKVHAVAHEYDFTQSSRLGWAIAYIVLIGFASYAVGLPDAVDARTALFSSIAASVIATVGISVVQLFAGDALLPRLVVFGSAVLVIPWNMLDSALVRRSHARARDRDRLILVSGRAERDALEGDLGDAERPAVLMEWLESSVAATILDGAEPLVDAAVVADASVLVLSHDAMDEPAVVAQAAVLHESGVRVRSLVEFYEEWLGKLPISELERASLMFDIGEIHRVTYARVKRGLDVLVALVLLPVLAVVTVFVAIGDVFANRGSLLFRQSRVGRNGREFVLLKFRSMTSDPDRESEWTSSADARVTRFGRVLRRAHIDELPQVVNILRGDLALVGPRPEQVKYVHDLEAKLPFYRLRHLVRPGLTGWAQVRYRYGATEEDALEKLQFEFWYLRHQSLGLDLRIVGRTARSVVGQGGQ